MTHDLVTELLSHLCRYAVQIAQKIKVLTCVYYNLTRVYYKFVIGHVYQLNHPCVDNGGECYKIAFDS